MDAYIDKLLSEVRPVPALRSQKPIPAPRRQRPIPAPRRLPFNLDQRAAHPVPPPDNVCCQVGGGDQRQLDAKVIDQFVLQDGRTFRTQDAHTRISEVCRKLLGDDMLANELANRVFGENHATSVVARDKNGWKPTPAAVLDDIQNACVEHGHGSLWNTPEGYDQAEVMSIDMKSCGEDGGEQPIARAGD